MLMVECIPILSHLKRRVVITPNGMVLRVKRELFYHTSSG